MAKIRIGIGEQVWKKKNVAKKRSKKLPRKKKCQSESTKSRWSAKQNEYERMKPADWRVRGKSMVALPASTYRKQRQRTKKKQTLNKVFQYYFRHEMIMVMVIVILMVFWMVMVLTNRRPIDSRRPTPQHSRTDLFTTFSKWKWNRIWSKASR